MPKSVPLRQPHLRCQTIPVILKSCLTSSKVVGQKARDGYRQRICARKELKKFATKRDFFPKIEVYSWSNWLWFIHPIYGWVTQLGSRHWSSLFLFVQPEWLKISANPFKSKGLTNLNPLFREAHWCWLSTVLVNIFICHSYKLFINAKVELLHRVLTIELYSQNC